MKQNPTSAPASSNVGPTKPGKFPFFALTCVVLLAGIGTLIFLANWNQPAGPGNHPVTNGAVKAPSPDQLVETTGIAGGPSNTTQLIVPRKAHTGGDGSDAQPSADMRLLVASLTQLNLNRGPMSVAEINAWRQNFQRLTASGAAAVPAIREFLQGNVDVSFDAASAKLLGETTVRLAMLEALQNIGGPDAIAVSSEVLQTTLDPREIAWLAQSLEQQAPGQYAEMATQAARDALEAAESGQLGERDVGAVFGVLQKFGGEDALTDLEKYSEQYQYYAVLALGNMPDGAGLSSLMTMLRDPEAASARGPVLQMLAQLSLDSPQALNMLLDQARQNQITSSTWVSISQILSGERLQMGTPPPDSDARTFHVATGNQNLYMLPGQSEWTPDEINRYKDVLKQLADASPNPTAATSLKTALTTWETRVK